MINVSKFYYQGHNSLTLFIAIHVYSIIVYLNQTAVIEFLTVILEYIYKCKHNARNASIMPEMQPAKLFSCIITLALINCCMSSHESQQ